LVTYHKKTIRISSISFSHKRENILSNLYSPESRISGNNLKLYPQLKKFIKSQLPGMFLCTLCALIRWISDDNASMIYNWWYIPFLSMCWLIWRGLCWWQSATIALAPGVRPQLPVQPLSLRLPRSPLLLTPHSYVNINLTLSLSIFYIILFVYQTILFQFRVNKDKI
jgi:hypothetical protein